jgi:hypothetical protein
VNFEKNDSRITAVYEDCHMLCKNGTFRKVSLGIWRGEKEEFLSELPLFYVLSPSNMKCWV